MATRLGRDYGAAARFGLAHAIGAVVVLTAGIGMVAFQFVRDRNAHVATAQAWDIKGPPCPQVSAADWTARQLKAPKTFDYDGTQLGRWSGDASCSDVKDKGGSGFRTDKICQFTSPTVLTVTTPTGTTYYETGAGQPATLSLHRDVPRCVLASKFTLKTE
ncbi:hypothetical protein [Phenylobacterium sp.]|uniref:hypothetical protein n=1 Tax=Phenylobacterium sp. TaxID=1871053 RepID=UPI003567242B